MPSRIHKFASAALLSALITALPIALADPQGALKGHSGSPDSYARSPVGGICTECHVFLIGAGSIDLFGAPQRYRAGETYDLTVRISDLDATQSGAGFEVSAEGPGGHQGTLGLIDTTNTKFAENDPDYVTHTGAGYQDSLDQWIANGRSYDYRLSWVAPSGNVGPVTLFVAGSAVSNSAGQDDDHYYAKHVTMPFGVPGDADSDGDVDLFDFAAVQLCFSGSQPATGPGCQSVDFNDDGRVDDVDADAFFALPLSGPTRISRTSGFPPGYVVADMVRGGLLYDKWWKVNGAPAPFDPDTDVDGSHPLYPTDVGSQRGSSTFRCKECHGWDYKGRDGAYGTGSHFSDIPGIDQTTLSPQALFNLLKEDPDVVPNGHDMDEYDMSDADIWDVVRMTLEGVVDTADYIFSLPVPFFFGPDLDAGADAYDTYCASCHDDESDPARGTWLNFGSEASPVYLDNLTRANPYEVLHKMRFGHPGSAMPSLELVGYDSILELRNLGGFMAAECLMGRHDCDPTESCFDNPVTGFTCE